MSDPKRLLDEAGDELGLSLLRAGRVVDADEAKKRSLALFGVAGAAAAATSAGAAKSSLFKGILVKWVGLGLVTTVIAAGIAARVLSTPEKSVTATVHGVLAEHPVQAPPAIDAPAAPAPKAAEAPALTPGISIDSLPSANADEAPPAAKTGAAEPSSTLAQEVSSLREAREALAAGQTQKAMAALDAYGQRFPGGHLALEAEELRIEALARSGNAGAASARAKAFLAAHPQSPYAHRLRAIASPNGEP